MSGNNPKTNSGHFNLDTFWGQLIDVTYYNCMFMNCRLTDYKLLVDVINVDCDGGESNFNSCSIDINNNNCSQLPYLICGE